jgi:hypothetical protein
MSPAWSRTPSPRRWPPPLGDEHSEAEEPGFRSSEAIIGANPKEGVATDILFLVERLESLVAAAKKVPLTNNVVLDQAAMLELVDQLRISVPDEVRQAKRITEEVTRITEHARDEADQIAARAQEQAAQMLEERELVKLAQQRAAEIIEQASREAGEVRRGADEYAAGVLIRLEGECIKALTSIKRGIDMLDERHRGAPAPTEEAPSAQTLTPEKAGTPARS